MVLTTKLIEVTTARIAAKESPRETCFRLAHDGVKVIALFESTGYTWTRGNLFCATTEKECLDKIAQLKLEYKPEAIDDRNK
jgi:hypothetical protein